MPKAKNQQIAKKDRPQWQKIAKKVRPSWQYFIYALG